MPGAELRLLNGEASTLADGAQHRIALVAHNNDRRVRAHLDG